MQHQGISTTTKIAPSSRVPVSEPAFSSAGEPGSPAHASCAGVEIGVRDLVLRHHEISTRSLGIGSRAEQSARFAPTARDDDDCLCCKNPFPPCHPERRASVCEHAVEVELFCGRASPQAKSRAKPRELPKDLCICRDKRCNRAEADLRHKRLHPRFLQTHDQPFSRPQCDGTFRPLSFSIKKS